MTYWDTKKMVDKLVKAHEESKKRMNMKIIKRLWEKKITVPFLETQAEYLLKKVHDKIKKNKHK